MKKTKSAEAFCWDLAPLYASFTDWKKELEKEHVPTSKEELKEMEEFSEDAESARKLLKPAWYLKKSKKNK